MKEIVTVNSLLSVKCKNRSDLSYGLILISFEITGGFVFKTQDVFSKRYYIRSFVFKILISYEVLLYLIHFLSKLSFPSNLLSKQCPVARALALFTLPHDFAALSFRSFVNRR